MPRRNLKLRTYKQHVTYFLLALLFAIIAISSFYLNQKVLSSYKNSIYKVKTILEAQNKLLHLNTLATDLNAPGNDVFISGDPDKEKEKFNQVKHEMEESIQKYRQYFANAEKNVFGWNIESNLDAIDKMMHELSLDAYDIFEEYKNKNEKEASKHMAEMDRAYAFLSQEISQAIHLIGKLSHILIKNELDQSSLMKHIELMIAIVFFALIIVIVFFGYRTSTQQTSIYLDNHKRRKYLDALVNTVLESVITIDRYGVITSFNKSAENLFGYTRDEILGKKINILMPDPDKKQHDQYLSNYFKTGKAKIIGKGREVMALKKSGEIIPVALSVNRYQVGNEVSFVGTIRDITDQKEWAAQLKQYAQDMKRKTKEISIAKQKVEHANHLKSAFLAGMSHEIRTPITAILGYAEIIQNLSPDQQNATSAGDYATKIISSSEHLLALINDILDFSKIEAGQLTIESRFFETQKIINDIQTIFSEIALKKQINLKVSILSNLPSMIKSDEVRIKQVIVNLLGNAIKFTPNKGNVDCTFEYHANDHLFKVEVKDTGIGIAKENLDIIFDPFSQEDKSTTRKFGGTGLGLSISRNLCRKLQGDLTVKSQINRGSTFIATFKPDDTLEEAFILNNIQAQTTTDELHETHFLNCNILVADDVVDNQNIIKHTLNQLKIQYDIANNGQEAFEMAKQGQYDLVLMDIRMPMLDGYEATMKLIEIGYKAPIIALTANAMKEDVEKYQQAGFKDVLAKPFRSKDLIGLVKKHLSNLQVEAEVVEDEIEEFSQTAEFKALEQQFIQRIPEDIQKLEHLAKMQNTTDLKIAVHNLKSVLKMFGFHEQSQQAAEIEAFMENTSQIPNDKLQALSQSLLLITTNSDSF